jgi:hypothetical protein
MKKKHYLLIFFIIFLVVFYIFYQYKRNEFLNMQSPVLQSNAKVIKFIDSIGINGEVIFPTSLNNFKQFDTFYRFNCIVFDSNFSVLTHNSMKYGGECFQDIKDKICNNKSLLNKNLLPYKEINNKQLYESMFNNISLKSSIDSTIVKNKYDYIIVWQFAIYKGFTYGSELKDLNECISSSNKKVLLLLLNMDYNESWYSKNNKFNPNKI